MPTFILRRIGVDLEFLTVTNMSVYLKEKKNEANLTGPLRGLVERFSKNREEAEEEENE